MPRLQVVQAIFLRNFGSYFSSVLGYLFIFVFVLVGGLCAFNERFFTANEPNLDQLTNWYPLLLLFIIPAITMSVWADERKTGTDELLFTLPATDLEILLAKYFAALAVYTVALLFSTTHVMMLAYLGNPDWGLLATTYFGYWLAGAALIGAGMLGSILTNNVTVAFVLGIVICAIPVFIGDLGALTPMKDSLEQFSIREQFRDFGAGIVPLTSLLYFTGFAVLMLYLNLVRMSKRHWDSNRTGSLGLQFALRAISLACVVVCIMVWARYAAAPPIDATSEKLFTLSPLTNTSLKEIDSERPIQIQAYVSPEVPREYVDTRKRLLGLLRQFDKLGGSKLEVRYVDVEPDSTAVEEAEHFGITPRTVVSDNAGRRTEVETFLGAVVISSYRKVVIPFFGKGLPIEYELTRAIQTVAKKDRLTVGILQTDSGVEGGIREISEELGQQYEVKDIPASSEIDADDIDVLIAVMPSALTAPDMNNLVAYVKDGNPILIFDDPYPHLGRRAVSDAPRHPKPNPNAQNNMFGGGPPGPQKADGGRATQLLNALGIEWVYDRVVFDMANPHPEYELLPAEYVFLTNDNGNDSALSQESEITSGLQELVAIYAGTITKDSNSDVEFTPLLSTGPTSGLLTWNEFTEDPRPFPFGPPMAAAKMDPDRVIDKRTHTIAALIEGDGDQKVNAIFVADVDMIGDFFFQERTMGNLELEFDNVSFLLNAVDTLAGDDTFIRLRSRRRRQRTLQKVEEEKQEFTKAANAQTKKANKDAEKQLKKRQEELEKQVEAIDKNENLDPIAKRQMKQAAAEQQSQLYSIEQGKIEQEKRDKIRKIDRRTKRQIRNLEKNIQFRAVFFPPLLPAILGLVVFFARLRGESQRVDPARRRN